MKRSIPHSTFLSRFMRDEQGSILVIFALVVVFLIGIGGAGVDLGMQQLESSRIQTAADAAAIGAASTEVASGTSGPVQQVIRTGVAQRYFALNRPAGSAALVPVVTFPNPTPTSSGPVRVQASSSRTAAFTGMIGTPTLNSNRSSTAGLSEFSSSDYDVVMVVDESGSTGGGASCSGGSTRMACMQQALRAMADSIVPKNASDPSYNPNVRMGFIGYSNVITNKWGLSANNADAKTAINNLRPIASNFDHRGIRSAWRMIQGGFPSIANAQYPNSGPVDFDTPRPRTTRTATTTTDANGLATLKHVIFITDGDIMVEPSGSGYYYDSDVAAVCGTGFMASSSAQCTQVFLNACSDLKGNNGRNDVHVYTISYMTAPRTAAQNTAMRNCASPRLKPTAADPTDYYFASTPADLVNILTNITTQIQAVRITQ